MNTIIKSFTILLLISSLAGAQERFGDISVSVDSSLSRRFQNTVAYRDSAGNVFLKLKVMPQGDIMLFESGSPYENKGAIVFSELTQEELEFLIAEVRYFEKRKKVKRD